MSTQIRCVLVITPIVLGASASPVPQAIRIYRPFNVISEKSLIDLWAYLGNFLRLLFSGAPSSLSRMICKADGTNISSAEKTSIPLNLI